MKKLVATATLIGALLLVPVSGAIAYGPDPAGEDDPPATQLETDALPEETAAPEETTAPTPEPSETPALTDEQFETLAASDDPLGMLWLWFGAGGAALVLALFAVFLARRRGAKADA